MQLPASEIGWCGFHGVGVYMGQFARFKSNQSLSSSLSTTQTKSTYCE
jgi:hypothetical protein